MTGGTGATTPLALLFDLDGTLVDSIGLILACFRYAFASHGLPGITDAELTRGIGTPLAAQFRQYARDDAHLNAMIETYREHQREQHDKLLREYAGIRELLAELQQLGHPIAIVTSKGEPLARRALEFTKLDRYVDLLVGLESTAIHKPHPAPVLHALQALGRDASAAIFVGDSPHDIAAGKAAGVATVGVTWGAFDREALTEAGADHIVDSVAALRELILSQAAAIVQR